MAFGREKKRKTTTRPIVTPDNIRRQELKAYPRDAETIDEEIFVTRNRLSSLNGAINGLIAKRPQVEIAGMMSWGIFSEQLKSDTADSCKINKKTILSSVFLEQVISQLPNYKYADEVFDEANGIYYIAAMTNQNEVVYGLHSDEKLVAWTSTLASFGVLALNLKLRWQLDQLRD